MLREEGTELPSSPATHPWGTALPLPGFAHLQNGEDGRLATFATQAWNGGKGEVFMKCFELQREQALHPSMAY